MTPDDLQKMTVSEVKEFLEAQPHPDETLLNLLESDQRSGVKKIADQIRRQQKAAAKEKARLENMALLENKLRSRGLAHIAGVDEAGRGPLAGPVVAAAVILPPNTLIAGLNDSKKLKETARDALFEQIQDIALSIGIGQASAQEIDDINIRNATHLAMRRALDQLSPPPDKVLVDGNAVPESTFQEMAIIGGDRKSLSIAAASIIAKVTRDRQMQTFADQYPEYGFAGHKGYGSAGHLEALRKHGPSPIHRLSFGGVPPCQQTFSEDHDIFLDGIESAATMEQLTAMGDTIASVSQDLQPHEIDSLRAKYRKRLENFNKTGPKGESLAAQFLKKSGFKICAQNYRRVGGEIDLIVQKDNTLSFVEVKTTTQPTFGDPSTWVTPQKQSQIIKIAKVYLQDNPTQSHLIRFDVITINMAHTPPEITHIEAAFSERS